MAFFVVLQDTEFNIVFQWNGLGELVSMMKQNLCCSIDDFYGECESRFLEMMGTIVSREWEDEVKGELYEAGRGGWKASILGGRS